MQRNPQELRFLNSLYNEVNGRIGPAISLETLSSLTRIDMESLLEIADSLNNEELINITPKVAGESMRLVSLTINGKNLVLSNDDSAKDSTRTIKIGKIGDNNVIRSY